MCIQEDSQRKMTIVTPMTEIPVTDMHQVVHRLRDALKRRSVAATNMNEQSSRAHTIIRLNCVIQDRGRAGRARVRYSTLTFVDLAGSERLKKSESTGLRACAPLAAAAGQRVCSLHRTLKGRPGQRGQVLNSPSLTVCDLLAGRRLRILTSPC